MDPNKFLTKFKSLPQSIRDWMGSEEVFLAATSIYDHFGIIDESAISLGAIIKELLIGDLDPKYFSGKISLSLSLDKDRALLISKELKRLIFFPLREEFTKAGLNIDQLDVFEVPIVKTAPIKIEEIKKPEPILKTPISTPAPTAPGAISSTPSANPTPAKPSFVLLKQEIKPIVPNHDIKIASPIANTGINFISKAPTPPAKFSTPKAAQIQIGNQLAPKQQEIARTEVPTIKVVHYSQMKSPVSKPITPGATPSPLSFGDLINKTSSQNNNTSGQQTPGFTPIHPLSQFPKQARQTDPSSIPNRNSTQPQIPTAPRPPIKNI